MRNINWATLRDIHDHFAPIAVNLFNREGKAHPQLFLVELGDDKRPRRMLALPPELLGPLFSDGSSKDLLAEFMAQALNSTSALRQGLARHFDCRPEVIVQVNEVWMSKPASKDEEELFKSGAMLPSTDPRRQEAVMVTLHTAFGSVPCTHPIVDEPSRHCVKSAFPDESSIEHFGGRFALHAHGQAQGPAH